MGNLEAHFEEDNNGGLDDDERAILNFIIENPGQTVNSVGKCMNDTEVCAKETARKKIIRLMDLKLVEDRKNKANGFHKLYASDKRQYNLIYGELLELDEVIKTMDKFPDSLSSRFEEPFLETVSSILRFLLIKTVVSGMSDYDSRALILSISKLMVKLNQQLYNVHRGIDVLKRMRPNLNRVRKELSAQHRTKENKMCSDLLENLVTHSENCEKAMVEFLSKTETKS